MSALPRQAAQQLQEVEELERQLYAEPQEPSNPVGEKEPTPTVVAPPPESGKDSAEVWEQRYKSLQGMFQAEVPRLQQQNKDMQQQNQELAVAVQNLQQQLADLAKPKAQAVEPLITDKDRETYGSDMLELMERVTKQVMREHVAPLQAELGKRDQRIAQLEGAVQKTSGDVSALSFDQRLRLRVPDFDVLNNDPKWAAWLDETDPFTKEPRRAYAEYVYQAGDADKVANIVDLYKASQAPVDTTAAQRQVELAKQVQPSRSQATPAPTSHGKATYTEAQCSALWNKVRKLNIEGRNDDAAKLEAELTMAYAEGRVTA